MLNTRDMFVGVLCVTLAVLVAVSGQSETEKGNVFIHHVFLGKPCTKHRLDGGRVKFKMGGKLAKYICDRNKVLVGDSMSVCVNGIWSHNRPVCAGMGCKPPNLKSEGVIQSVKATYNGHVVAYDYSCQEGYYGNDTRVYCNGNSWLGTRPICYKIQGISCDFEDDQAPGCDEWVNDDNGFWVRHTDETTNEGTGPSYDHTKGVSGEGHYMYVDSSKATPGQVARLFSINLYPDMDWCVAFWYHMYGKDADATLLVATETQVQEAIGDFEPVILLEGNHGDQWRYTWAKIPEQMKPFKFQVVFEATMNTSTKNDIAIDDVTVTPCTDLIHPTTVAIETTYTSAIITTDSTEVTSSSERSTTVTEMTSMTSLGDQWTMASNVTDYVGTPGEALAARHSSVSKTTIMVVAGVMGGAICVMFVLALVLHQVVKKRKKRSDEDNESGAFAYQKYQSDSAL